MKELIDKTYDDLMVNTDDFSHFIESMEKYSTEEIISLYGVDSVVKGVRFLSNKQSLKQTYV